MLEKKFLIDKEALVAASKVAYLVHLIRNSDSIIEKYKIADIEDITQCQHHTHQDGECQRCPVMAAAYP